MSELQPATPPFDASELAAFTVILAEPVPAYEDSAHPATRAYKKQLDDLTGNFLAPNGLGQLAKGLARGRITTLLVSGSTGLYEGTFDENHNLRGITLHEPTQLYQVWGKAEEGVRVAYQKAMRNLIESALGHQPTNIPNR